MLIDNGIPIFSKPRSIGAPLFRQKTFKNSLYGQKDHIGVLAKMLFDGFEGWKTMAMAAGTPGLKEEEVDNFAPIVT